MASRHARPGDGAAGGSGQTLFECCSGDAIALIGFAVRRRSSILRRMHYGNHPRRRGVADSEPERVETGSAGAHITLLDVARADIDAYDHVNKRVYMAWFDRVAWEHSAALVCRSKDAWNSIGHGRMRSLIAYLRPACWATRFASRPGPAVGGKLRVRRRFQVRRESDRATLARSRRSNIACIELSTGARRGGRRSFASLCRARRSGARLRESRAGVTRDDQPV